MTQVRTYYLNWRGLAVEDLPMDMGARSTDFPERMARLWTAGKYIAGPVERAVPRNPRPEATCDWLFHKYNSDDRPDGQRRRSMSVGDVVRIGSELWLCRSQGWERFQENVPSLTEKVVLANHGIATCTCGEHFSTEETAIEHRASFDDTKRAGHLLLVPDDWLEFMRQSQKR